MMHDTSRWKLLVAWLGTATSYVIAMPLQHWALILTILYTLLQIFAWFRKWHRGEI